MFTLASLWCGGLTLALAASPTVIISGVWYYLFVEEIRTDPLLEEVFSVNPAWWRSMFSCSYKAVVLNLFNAVVL